MTVESSYTRPKEKRPHPTVPELVLGADLSSRALKARGTTALADVMTNGEYWLSFELSSFEPMLARAPSPLRELGVGLVLRYGEGMDGRLDEGDLAKARAELAQDLPPDLQGALAAGLAALESGLRAREAILVLEGGGFSRCAASTALSVNSLRAGGTANIHAADRLLVKDVELSLGVPHALRATDDRGRALSAPEIESETGAPIWAKPVDKNEARQIVLVVPGRYRLRVPGRAEAVVSVLAR